ncbi:MULTISPECIES: transferrin-binding protein-like solute binding protein [Eikenella]|uniref:Transferrin-binding protein B C-lobe/N-lobe beta-barrel domain-containing protein n=1 Tax=Eikenella longinqua TaxID=1795827 RepID=A0A1A9RUT5_9NEIS|nr:MULTISPECIES: transferrin-binding protein-like solute binding protein [Eikenella]OAM26370.1 hypothetical protein A7P95_09285 [Eikenella longinqua]
MKTSTLLALTLAAFGLSACAGGSSGSILGDGSHNPSPNPNPNPQPNPQPDPVVSRTNHRLQITPGSYAFIAANAQQFADSGRINQLIVEGKTIDIIPDGITAGTTYSEPPTPSRERAVGSSSLSYTRFGYVRDNTANGYMVAQGETATDMPTTGSAVYNGYAVLAKVGGSGLSTGSSRFDVNFDGAQPGISGIINVDSDTITLGDFGRGQIAGSNFSGTGSGTGSGPVSFQGSFYGPNAAELGGVFHKQGEYSGAFGAAKQPQQP